MAAEDWRPTIFILEIINHYRTRSREKWLSRTAHSSPHPHTLHPHSLTSLSVLKIIKPRFLVKASLHKNRRFAAIEGYLPRIDEPRPRSPTIKTTISTAEETLLTKQYLCKDIAVCSRHNGREVSAMVRIGFRQCCCARLKVLRCGNLLYCDGLWTIWNVERLSVGL